ncbi:ANGPTL7 [Branchiostoma lanceolatum]|uniref:ANGPTL7 protein n=1 Tax=Branchiostoma lanceolatum TaxID=7740 RepID=A0A8K0EGP6_BRALA|nr:ANGPTL7 [Branchiostoma lanceolatum]
MDQKMKLFAFLLFFVTRCRSQSTLNDVPRGHYGFNMFERAVREGRCTYTFIVPEEDRMCPSDPAIDMRINYLELAREQQQKKSNENSRRIDRMEKMAEAQRKMLTELQWRVGNASASEGGRTQADEVPRITEERTATSSSSGFVGCAGMYRQGATVSGRYTVQVDTTSFPVYCDMVDSGGGWTVIQRRLNGSVDFFRNWGDYRQGFGNVRGEFWLGNDKIRLLTSQQPHELQVTLTDWDDRRAHAQYAYFYLEPESDKYRLRLGWYTGTAGDALSYHNGRSFSTTDQDNDSDPSACADRFRGGWWYGGCHHSNLNGLYHPRGEHIGRGDGIEWIQWKGMFYSVKSAEMKIRPANFGHC